jgi:hypothetical protein
MTLSIKKCHFTYLSLKLLSHYILRLGITITEDKIEAIKVIRFPDTLKSLKTGISFFNYYRRYIAHYSKIMEPLHELKVLSFKNGPRKKKTRECFAEITALDFNKNLATLASGLRRILLNYAR